MASVSVWGCLVLQVYFIAGCQSTHVSHRSIGRHACRKGCLVVLSLQHNTAGACICFGEGCSACLRGLLHGWLGAVHASTKTCVCE